MNPKLEALAVKTLFIHVQSHTGETIQNGFNKLITFHLQTTLINNKFTETVTSENALIRRRGVISFSLDKHKEN